MDVYLCCGGGIGGSEFDLDHFDEEFYEEIDRWDAEYAKRSLKMKIIGVLREKIEFILFCCLIPLFVLIEFIKNITGNGISEVVYENSKKIHDIANYGNVSQLVEVIDSGVSFNHKNHHSTRPIHYAVLNRDSSVLLKLIEYGADVTCIDGFGLQPIHYLAQCQGSIDNLKILLDKGADINTKDCDGHTPLYHALQETTMMKLRKVKSNTELINALIIHGADTRDLNGSI